MQPASANDVALAEPGAWASSLGERWKYLQTSLATETAENRQVYMEEELRRALLATPAAQRGAYLEALATRYPAWELAAVALNAPAAVTRQKPDEIIAAFLQLVPQLSDAQREGVKQKLAALGLVATAATPIEGEALTEVQAKLKLEPEDPIGVQQLGKVFALYVEAMLTLDQLAWNVWRNAAPKSAIRRDTAQGDLRTVTRRALAGDATLPANQVQKQIEASRLLIAGLLAGLGPAGKNFSRRYQQYYAPDAIREVLRAEGGGKSDAHCWKKYTELATQLSETVIEDDVQEAVVKYAEDLMRSSGK
ncbi:MAG TPA: hypothetical protein PLQ52_02550 [Lacunisphaera sp.]|mgnify:FL=1|jgi:hypothetical protein|nr:hypothetical protein [Lacunisphaera sp.]HQY04923.1 hypothetical protein [Lacunisphaera sp.]